MDKILHLFIGDKEVEFTSEPKVLFNYKATELNNPTITKNGWSKSITVDATAVNDDIFGFYWHLDRAQGENNFNAMKKVPFRLYDSDNAIIQKGYVRLDEVKATGEKKQYTFSLFGGLGSFFYNLSYFQDDSSNQKKNLSSLVFPTLYDNVYDGIKPGLDFKINKDSVHDAWCRLMGEAGYGTNYQKWDYINFAPTYNGIPNDFDAEHALINNYNIYHGIYPNSATDNNVVYKPLLNGRPDFNGFSSAEVGELTCDESLDFRSYLQRPVFNVRKVLTACFDPVNNGGYQVKLDSHFFNEDNPYWTKGWCTLPMLRDMEIRQGESYNCSAVSLTQATSRLWDINFDAGISTFNSAEVTIQLGMDVSGTTPLQAFSYNHLKVDTGVHIFDGYHWVKDLIQSTGVMVQLWGLDSQNNVVAASDAYLFGDSMYAANGAELWSEFYKPSAVPEYRPSGYKFIKGHWYSRNYQFSDLVFYPDSLNTDSNFVLKISSSAPMVKLQLKIKIPYSYAVKYAWAGEYNYMDGNYINGYQPHMPLFDSKENTASGDIGLQAALRMNKTEGDYEYKVSATITAVDDEAFFSDTDIPVERLLATSYSPAEFLISYGKLFNLYFYQDPEEEADDPVVAPNGVIHIMDRNTFFTGEYVDITDNIDRSRDIKVNPTMAGSKWYNFENEPIESDAGNSYKSIYGFNYGRQLINTGYEFDSNTTNLYDGTVFKSGIMVREKDKYFAQPIDAHPIYTWNGMKISLFSQDAEEGGYNTYEYEVPTKKWNTDNINNLGLEGYDLMPKLQCHTEKNEASDGEGVLLFYNGEISTMGEWGYTNYWITDDINDMVFANDGQPCWIITADEYNALGQRIAWKMRKLPLFTRDIILFGSQQGNIVHSWNFGHPMETFVPNTYTTDGDCLYDKFWKAYINDLYNVDSKRVTLSFLPNERPNVNWLRKWWYFDNGIWRMNEIKDWDVTSDGVVQCEFIKVQDVNNYALSAVTYEGIKEFYLERDTVGNSGGTVTGHLYLQNGGHWYTGDDSGIITGYDRYGNYYLVEGAISPVTGAGTYNTFTVTIPPNSGNSGVIEWTINIEDDFDNHFFATILQTDDNNPFIEINSDEVIVDVFDPYTINTKRNLKYYASIPTQVSMSGGDASQFYFTVGQSGNWRNVSSFSAAAGSQSIAVSVSGHSSADYHTTAIIAPLKPSDSPFAESGTVEMIALSNPYIVINEISGLSTTSANGWTTISSGGGRIDFTIVSHYRSWFCNDGNNTPDATLPAWIHLHQDGRELSAPTSGSPLSASPSGADYSFIIEPSNIVDDRAFGGYWVVIENTSAATRVDNHSMGNPLGVWQKGSQLAVSSAYVPFDYNEVGTLYGSTLAGSYRTIEVDAAGDNWTVSNTNPDDFGYVRNSSLNFKIYPKSANTDTWTKSGEFVVQYGDVRQVITVEHYQKPWMAFEPPRPDTDSSGRYIIPVDGGHYLITVHAKNKWWVRSSYFTPIWTNVADGNVYDVIDTMFTPSGSSTTFDVYFGPNTNPNTGTGYLNLAYQNLSGSAAYTTEELQLIQYTGGESALTINPSVFNVPAQSTSATYHCDITSTEAWTASTGTPFIGRVAGWEGEAGKKTLLFYVMNNTGASRKGSIKITTASGAEKVIKINQSSQ